MKTATRDELKAHGGLFLGLALLLLANIGLAYLPLGSWHAAVALAPPLAMAVLVMTRSMRLREAGPAEWIAGLVGFAWLLILLGLTLTDMLARIPVPPPW